MGYGQHLGGCGGAQSTCNLHVDIVKYSKFLLFLYKMYHKNWEVLGGRVVCL